MMGEVVVEDFEAVLEGGGEEKRRELLFLH